MVTRGVMWICPHPWLFIMLVLVFLSTLQRST